MAVPDIQDLYERYLQMLGRPSNSARPTSEPRTQPPPLGYATPSEAIAPRGDYPSGGGVLGVLGSPSRRTPWSVQAFSPSSAAVASRGPWPIGRSGLGIGVPMPPPPGRIVEIPNPHLERFIPQSTRDIWSTAALLPWILRRKAVGDEGPNGPAEEQNESLLPEHSPEPPANRPGNRPPSIVGPATLENARRREDSPATEPQTSGQPDPNHRELRTVSPDSQEPGSTSDLSDPSLIGWRKRGKKTFRGTSPGGRGSRQQNSTTNNAGGWGGGRGFGRGFGDDDDDYCSSRRWEEEGECKQRRRDLEYAHPDFYGGCMARASARWDACNRNGGTPPPWEPKKWSLDPDEEVFINIGR